MDKLRLLWIKTVKRFVCTSILLCSFSWVTAASQDSVEQALVNYFQEIGKTPQEKLYLHLDKSYYSAGETIWFKGYLLNAITHRDDSPSNYIYLELVDKGDSVLCRYKFKRDSIAGFRGNFQIPATLPAGDYYLRGYSSWMRNGDPDFFYYRNLKIGNSIINDILSEVIEQPNAAGSDRMKIRFYQGGGQPYSDITVSYTISRAGEKLDRGEKKTDDNGILEITSPSLLEGRARVDVRFENGSMDYATSFFVDNSPEDEYSVSFFPEGGDLLSGVLQRVAFKAQAATGFSLPVEGFVMNDRGDTVSTFVTEHDGMGVFSFTPELGVNYVAHTQSDKGVIKQFPLPAVCNGIGLSMTTRDGSIFYQVQKSPALGWPGSLYLVVHVRGDLRFFVPLTNEKNEGKIDTGILPDGIAHFLLVDASGIPLSERLLFIRHPEAAKLHVETDRSKYSRRDSVKMQISLADVEEKPLVGNFSISVTDNSYVRQDTTVDHIVSALLLTSDLKGYVENPDYYINDPNDRLALLRADLVMMTHGWRRFRIENLMHPASFEGENYIEVGQTVSGDVLNGFGKGIEGASVMVYSPECFAMCMTDRHGRFLAEGIQFSDSVTQLIVQAQNVRGKSNLTVDVNEESFPQASNIRPYIEGAPENLGDYLSIARDQYYIEGGTQVYRLREVEVRGQKREKDVYRAMADITIDREDMPTFAMGYSAFDYVRTLNGITLRYKEDGTSYLSIRGSEYEPLTLIDEVPYRSNETLKQIQMKDVASVSIIKGAQAAFFGTRGGGGVVSITRLDGSQPISDKPAPGVAFISRLGYHVVKDFYTPTYATPEQKQSPTADKRTTVYWNPAIQFDSSGIAQVDFYMPDNAGPCCVTIEGVTEEGYPVRYLKNINE